MSAELGELLTKRTGMRHGDGRGSPDTSTLGEDRPWLTVFSIPKSFRGHIGVIQRNALRSWTLLRPRPEILVFGDEAGTKEACTEVGVRHVPEVAYDETGAPLLSDLFPRARASAREAAWPTSTRTSS